MLRLGPLYGYIILFLLYALLAVITLLFHTGTVSHDSYDVVVVCLYGLASAAYVILIVNYEESKHS